MRASLGFVAGVLCTCLTVYAFVNHGGTIINIGKLDLAAVPSPEGTTEASGSMLTSTGDEIRIRGWRFGKVLMLRP